MFPILKVRDKDGNVRTISVVAAPSVLSPHAESHKPTGKDPITPESIGAAHKNHSHTAAQVGASPIGHKHTAADVGAAEAEHTHVIADVEELAERITEVKEIAERINSISNEHLWAKSHYAESLGAAYSISKYNYNYVTVCDGIVVNPKTGEITTVNPHSVEFYKVIEEKGKYLDGRREGSTSAVDMLFKIGENAIFTNQTSNPSFLSDLSPVSARLETVGYVNSADENAYPIDDEFLYTYRGRIGGTTGFDVLSDTDVLNVLLGVTE